MKAGRAPKPIPSLGRQGRGLVLAIVALMAALGVLAMLAAGGLHHLAQRWQNALAGGLTVELPALAKPAERAAQTEKILAALRSTPGVAKAESLTRREIEALLAPWLGDKSAVGELPLPVLLHVELAPGSTLAPADLQTPLAAIATDVRVDDHGRWRAQFAGLARAVEWLAAAVLATVGAAAAIAVTAAVRTRLLIHRDDVAILHALGAADGFIARPIARDAWSLALKGGAIGLALAAAIGLGLAAATGVFSRQILLAPPVPPAALIGALALPLAIALLSVATAWFSLLRTLKALEHERGF
jgi:cell division transport system permease protein